MKRPVGVTVIAVLAIIGGILQLVGSLPYLGLALGLRAYTGPLASSTNAYAITAGMAMIAIGVLELVFGIGALRLSHWVWTFGVTVFIISLVVTVGQMFVFGFASGLVLWAAIDVIVLAYLYTHAVREAFGHLPSSTAGTGHPTPA